jgi:chromosome segregation ATPase
MNRRLQLLNLIGVLVLAVLCAAQWRRDRQLNLDVSRLEKTRLAQEEQIAAQEKAHAALNADLALFKEQLTLAKAEGEESRRQLRQSEAANRRLTAERDQIRENLTVWTNAVAQRDARIAEANDRIRDLGGRLNTSIEKFNELATNYAAVVKALKATRGAAEANAAPLPP